MRYSDITNVLQNPEYLIWDSIGLTMTSLDESGKDSAPVSRILIDWNIDLYGAISKDNIKWLKNHCHVSILRVK